MDLYAKLSAQMEEVSASIHSRMAQHEDQLKAAAASEVPQKTIDGLSSEFADFRNFVCVTLNTLRAQIELLVLGLDRHEMASRRKVLLLHGVKEESDPLPTIIRILSDQMELSEVAPADIAVCHRLGANKSKPRPLLIRFHQQGLRNDAWNAKTKLKGSGLTLSEFLTKPRHKVFMDARKHFGIKQAWTTDGKIIIQLPDRTKQKIETAVQLRDLMTRFPATAMQLTTEDVTHKTGKTTSARDSGKAPKPSAATRSRRLPK